VRKRKAKQNIKGIYYWVLCRLLHPKKKGLNPYEDTPVKYWITRRVPGKHRSALRLLVKGKTNKSGYTGWLKRKGKNYGVQAWFRRKDKDLLEALLVGATEDLEMVLNYAQKGNRRSVIESVEEYWFNKEVKQFGKPREEESEEEREDDGSQIDHKMWKETIELYRKNIHGLKDLFKNPNQYNEEEKFSVAGELNREAKIFGEFVMRHGFSNYIEKEEGPIGLQSTLNTNVSSSLRAVTDHKHITKQILDQAGLPVPKGEVFTDLNEAKEYVENFSSPVVVKPIEGSFGFGITVGVSTEEELEVAWHYAQKRHHEIMIEELVNGVDLRIIVVGGKAQAALLRVPANIQGDGESTINKLIQQKNKARSSNPRFNKTPLRVDDYTEAFLMKQGYNLESIPKSREVVFLHLKANVGAGADGVEITDYIHPDLMSLAEQASKALGVPDFWGIDMLAESVDRPVKEQRCCIIEVNSRASFGGLHYPVFGEPKNIAKKIIEYNCSPLQKNSRIVSAKARLFGELSKKIMTEIEELGRRFGLNGYIESRNDGGVLKVQGNKKNVQFFFSYMLEKKMESEGYIEGIQISWNNEKERCTSPTGEIERSENVPGFIEQLEDYSEKEYVFKEGADPDLDLFVRAGENKGYQVQSYSEDLLVFKKNREIGYLSSRFSTIFADEICEKRILMKKALTLKGLSVPKGIQLKGNEQWKALRYLENKESPCVITAYSLKNKKVKYCTSQKSLKSFWKKTRKKGANTYLVEEWVHGWNIHIPVVKNKAKGAFLSVPWEISGDGNTSIEELIREQNRKLEVHPVYKGNVLDIDESLAGRLEYQGYQLEEPLEKGKRLLVKDEGRRKGVKGLANIGEILHQEFYSIAEEALQSVPGLNFGVIDIVIPYPEQGPDEQYWAITDIQTKPSVTAFAHPLGGAPLLLAETLLEEVAFKGDVQWIKRRDAHED